ncbi:MAG TPA: hypothetical protein VGK86_05005 [Thermoanaerobaculia bacterium]
MTRTRTATCLLALLAGAALRADQVVQVGPDTTFTPSSVTVAPGEMVTWSFANFHTSTSDSSSGDEVWDSGFLSSGTFSHTFHTPGDYPYYCQVHSTPGGTTMNGVVHVVGATPTPTPTPPSSPTPTATRTRTPTATPTRTPTVTVTAGPSPTPLALVFHTLMPCRVADTRNSDGPYGGPALQASMERDFVITGQCGIPASARAVAFNVTVTQPTAQGHIILFPAGTSLPVASALNYRPGQTRANNAIVPLGSGGALAVVCGQSAGTTHFIIDVTGYFE